MYYYLHLFMMTVTRGGVKWDQRIFKIKSIPLKSSVYLCFSNFAFVHLCLIPRYFTAVLEPWIWIMQVDLSACDTKKTPKFQLEQKNNTKCMNGDILRWWHACYMTIWMADDVRHHNLTFLIFQWWFLLSIYIPTDLTLFQAIKSI